jgi:Tfp pilus assembly pilus retraction ATPase PilT
MNIDDLLRIAMERRASDLHLKVGNYPHLRIDGELFPLTPAWDASVSTYFSSAAT